MDMNGETSVHLLRDLASADKYATIYFHSTMFLEHCRDQLGRPVEIVLPRRNSNEPAYLKKTSLGSFFEAFRDHLQPQARPSTLTFRDRILSILDGFAPDEMTCSSFLWSIRPPEYARPGVGPLTFRGGRPTAETATHTVQEIAHRLAHLSSRYEIELLVKAANEVMLLLFFQESIRSTSETARDPTMRDFSGLAPFNLLFFPHVDRLNDLRWHLTHPTRKDLQKSDPWWAVHWDTLAGRTFNEDNTLSMRDLIEAYREATKLLKKAEGPVADWEDPVCRGFLERRQLEKRENALQERVFRTKASGSGPPNPPETP